MPTQTINVARRQNAKTWANKFRARLLEPGLVSYEDQGCGKALLTKQTIDNYIRTFIGRPLILSRNAADRPTYTHDTITPENMEEKADGYISDVEYDPTDGWWYAIGIVYNEEAKEAIREIGLVSCAYVPTETGPGGDHHNIPYFEEILAFEGEHLAIVKTPRYETATIRLNSKTKPTNTMFKWNQALSAAVSGAKKENATAPASGEIPADAAFQIDGMTVPVSEAIDAHKRLNSKEGEEVDDATIFQHNGKSATAKQLFMALNAKEEADEKAEKEKKENEAADAKKKEEEEAKKNAIPEAFKKDEDKKENASDEEKDEDKKENAADEEKDKEEKSKKENSLPRRFIVNSKAGPLSAARENGITLETTGRAPDTMEAKMARGSERYGARAK